ncbi:MAG: HpcH/HpaI aldolase/citrate lyase family protein [Bacteroidales bacterium]|nr:HpcH/HpaI aldolase/citrate lyase family protein [Bacteroidales bacterium]
MEKKASAGNRGEGVRSDCHITCEIREVGGIELKLQSRVNALFGEDIRNQVNAILDFYGVRHARIEVEDTGALPFVIAARMEAVLRTLTGSDREYLPAMLPENRFETERDRFRFSRLYLPGNTPRLMINAGIHKPHGIILDLEDAVAADRKYEARFVVRNALRQLNFYGAERMVRINQVPAGLEDIEYVAPHYVNLILIPKCESALQLRMVNDAIEEIRRKREVPCRIWLMPIIESALGVLKAHEIASAADNVVAIAIGLEDYTADLGTRRSQEGMESFMARSMVVNAARAAGIQAIDSVFSDISDMEALKQNIKVSKSLGFDGMGCIHPRQIKVIHENYAPDAAEIEKAMKITDAFIKATQQGLGVVSLGSKMIDPPVVKRAQRTINLAVSLGLLPENWQEQMIAQTESKQ